MIINMFYFIGKPSRGPLHPDYIPSIFKFNSGSSAAVLSPCYLRKVKRDMLKQVNHHCTPNRRKKTRLRAATLEKEKENEMDCGGEDTMGGGGDEGGEEEDTMRGGGGGEGDDTMGGEERMQWEVVEVIQLVEVH